MPPSSKKLLESWMVPGFRIIEVEISGAFSFYKQSLEPQVRQLGVSVLLVAVFYSLTIVIQELDPEGSAALSIIIITPA